MSMSCCSSSKKKMILLKSSDGKIFEVEEPAALLSQTIKNMIDDIDCTDTAIPLGNVIAKTLSKVIEYCNTHAKAAAEKASSDKLVTGASAHSHRAKVIEYCAKAAAEEASSGKSVAGASYGIVKEASSGKSVTGASSGIVKEASSRKSVAGGDERVDDKKKLEEDLKAFDKKLVDVDRSELFEILLAANYLDIKELLDLTAQTVADNIKNLTVEEIREIFGIVNDFTPEEENAVRQENSWAFE